MFSVGYITVILYLASLLAFGYAAFYPTYLVTGSALGVIFFLAGSVVLGIMIVRRKMIEFTDTPDSGIGMKKSKIRH